MNDGLDVGKGQEDEVDRHKDSQEHQRDWEVNDEEAYVVDLHKFLWLIL